MFIDWQFNGSRDEYLDPRRSQYHEFFVLMDARWQDTAVSWCPRFHRIVMRVRTAAAAGPVQREGLTAGPVPASR